MALPRTARLRHTMAKPRKKPILLLPGIAKYLLEKFKPEMYPS